MSREPRKLPEELERLIAASPLVAGLAPGPTTAAELRQLLEDVALEAARVEREACAVEVHVHYRGSRLADKLAAIIRARR